MNIEGLFSIGQFGLNYERLRLEAAIRNISLINTPLADGQSPTVASVKAGGGAGGNAFVDALESGDSTSGVPNLQVTEAPTGTRQVHDPSNPAADANGDVRYANIDMASEMTNLMSASRAYEANVRGINTLEQMAEKALLIGGR